MGGPTGRRIFNGLLRFFTNNVFVGVFQYHFRTQKHALELKKYLRIHVFIAIRNIPLKNQTVDWKMLIALQHPFPSP